MDSRGSFQEPNNRAGDEFCAVANFTESTGSAWGWADASCDLSWPFICVTKGVCPLLLPRLHVLQALVPGTAMVHQCCVMWPWQPDPAIRLPQPPVP